MGKGKEIVVRNAPGSRPSSGREFLVRVIEKGDRYGLGDKLVYDQKEPQIAFYDTKHAGDPRFGPHGQFVQQYYAFTMAYHHPGLGLDLLGHEPAWKLDAPAMDKVIDLAKKVTYGERAWQEEQDARRRRGVARSADVSRKKRSSRRPSTKRRSRGNMKLGVSGRRSRGSRR
jgi:hypothetical protein